MSYNVNRISNQIVQMAEIDPVVGAATVVSQYIPMSEHYSINAKVHAGVITTSVDAKLVQATDISGTGSKDIAGRSITQVTVASKNVAIELCHDDALLDDAAGFGFVALSITTLGASTVVSGEIFGGVDSLTQDSRGIQTYDTADETVRS